MQATIKKLGGKNPGSGAPLLLELPQTPRQLLAVRPDIARAVYSSTNLPVSSPLCPMACRLARSKINLRGVKAQGPIYRCTLLKRWNVRLRPRTDLADARCLSFAMCGYDRANLASTRAASHLHCNACARAGVPLMQMQQFQMPQTQPQLTMGNGCMMLPNGTPLYLAASAGPQGASAGAQGMSAGAHKMESLQNATTSWPPMHQHPAAASQPPATESPPATDAHTGPAAGGDVANTLAIVPSDGATPGSGKAKPVLSVEALADKVAKARQIIAGDRKAIRVTFPTSRLRPRRSTPASAPLQ